MRSVEISLKEIFVYVLYKWLPILLCAVIVGGLMGVNGFYTQIPKVQEAQDLIKEYEKAEAVIKNDIADLNRQTDGIATDGLTTDENSSAIFTNERIAKLAIDIAADSDKVDVSLIRRLYISVFANFSLKKIIDPLTDFSYSEESLRKIITVYGVNVNGMQSRLIISAVGGDELNPVLVVDALLNELMVNTDYVTSKRGDHALKMSELMVAASSNKETLLYQDEVMGLNDKIAALNEEINTIQSNKKEAANVMRPVKKAIQQAALGALIGIVIGVVAAAFFYALRIPVLVPEQLRQSLDIRYLGGVRVKKGRFISGLGDKVAGDLMLWPSPEAAVEYVSANLAGFVGREETVLLTGSLPADVIQVFADGLHKAEALQQVRFLVSGDITQNPDTIRALPDANHIVLIERLKQSKLKDVNNQVKAIDEISGKGVSGYVLY